MSTKDLELVRLDQLPEPTREVLCEVIGMLATKFTGDLRIDFNEGIPQVRRRTDTIRYQKGYLTKQP